MLLWIWIGCLLNSALYEEKSQELDGFVDADGDGFPVAEDCDDDDPSIYPGASERCDQRDNDCDGSTDEEAIDAIEWFLDLDTDGFGDDSTAYWSCESHHGDVKISGDCNDGQADIHPDADEIWYDGTDQNCDEWSDFDADTDGQDHIHYGGVDCNDQDSSVYQGATETWADIHIDNDCDGDTGDPIAYNLSAVSPLVGIQEHARLGAEQLELPPEWSGSEPILLVAAPGTHDDNGEVYALRPSTLMDLDSIEEAEWIMTGDWDDHQLGTGLARLGNPTDPITAISAPGTFDSRVYLFDEPLLDTEPHHPRIVLEAQNIPRVGQSMATGHDHDGDGWADLIMSRGYNTTDADAIVMFYEAHDLPNVLSIEDADLTLSIHTESARITMNSLGDVNGDGLSDLAVGVGSGSTAIPGGMIVTWSRSPGDIDIEDASATRFYGPMAQFGVPIDVDGDGTMELLAGPDHLYRFSLPLAEGTVDWSTAEATARLGDPNTELNHIHTNLPDYGDYSPVAIASAGAFDGAGRLFLLQPDWTDEIQLGDREPMVAGIDAGDGFGASMVVFASEDFPSGGFLAGSPGSDSNGENSGSLYPIPAPE